MKTLCLALLLSLSATVRAQDLNQEENKYLGYIYQQQDYQLNDPKGDVLLLWSAHQIPKFVLSSLKGKQAELLKERQEKIQELLQLYPQYRPSEESKNLIKSDYLDYNPDHMPIELEGHKAPFKIRNIVKMFEQVITEEYRGSGLKPQLGTVHEWSPDIKKQLKKKFVIFARMPKLLLALSRGSTSHYLKTGTEEQLKDYILSRPENSINLEEMFRASYRINNGDVYLTLLSVENVLNRFWLTPQRSKRALTTKLKDITNYNYRTDKFGSWYHLFGIMLYGYARGGLEARVVGNLETAGSQIMSRFHDEMQENYINNRGGPIGARLRKFIQKEKYLTFELDQRYLQEDFYMDLDEDFTKRLKKARKD